MASGFFRTIRTLEEDRFRGTLTVLIPVTVLLISWMTWFLVARVTLFETSVTARLESRSQIFPVDAPAAGAIAGNYLVVGGHVDKDAVLVEMDSQRARLELEAARSQLKEAEAATKFSSEESRRLGPLVKSGQVAEMDYLKSSAENEKNRAKAEQLAATIKKLEYELEVRLVRAPVAGRIGERNPNLQIGSLVKEGDHLATLIPDGEFKITAAFLPAAAMGRIKLGQRARLRLDGFPWAQFGSLDGEVTAVDSEVRDGHIRIEASVTRDATSAIPMQHGLPGVLEVEIGKVTPFHLVLRVAGAGINRASEPVPAVPGAVPPKPGTIQQ